MNAIDYRDPAPRRTLALACGVFLTAGLILAGLGPSLPQLALNVGYDIAALGWLFTTFSSGVVLAQLGAGLASERFGLRPVLTAGMLVMSAGILGVTLSASLATLLASGLLGGLGFGCVLAAGNVLVAGLYPARSAAVLNGANVFFGIGSVLGPAAVGLASARLGLPLASLWTAAALLAALAPALLVGRSRAPRRPAPTPERAGDGAARAPLATWLLGVLLLIYIGTEVGFGAWVTVYMIESVGLAQPAAALVASGFWLALTLGRVLATLLGMRMSPPALLLTALLGMLAGALALNLGVGGVGWSIAAVLLLGLSCGPVFPTILALATAAGQANRSAASVVLAVGNCGGLIFPLAIGLLLSRFGPPAVAWLVLGTTATMVALHAAIARLERRAA
jgi:fucose permease